MADGDPATSESIAARLARGEFVSDDDIDAHLPPWVALLSRTHWTPVEVARAAAQFLVGSKGSAAHVLDVGSGAGKFAVVGASCTGARFTGIERRPALVQTARNLAKATDARGAHFLVGRMEDLDWREFDGVYLYNPFGEFFLEAAEVIDAADRTSWSRYVHNVRATVARLYLMPTGTRVATYHGMGGPMPPGYTLVGREPFELGTLRFYERMDPASVETRRPPRDLFDDERLEDDTAEMFLTKTVDEAEGRTGTTQRRR
jgi:predicted RNA methylase